MYQDEGSTPDNTSQETSEHNCKIKFPRKLSKQKAPVFIAGFSQSHLNYNFNGILKFESYKSEEIENDQSSRILVADNGHLKYSGVSCENENVPLSYYVGVRNKVTGKMKIHDAARFKLKPLLSAQNSSVDNSISSLNKTYKDNRDLLTESFGSKIKKRALASRMKYETNPNNLESVKEAMSTIQVPVEIKPNLDTNKSNNDQVIDYIPPQNKSAQVASQVYSINDIISEEELEALESDASKLRNANPQEIESWQNATIYCKYVIEHITDENVDQMKAKCLVYYNYLISFHRLKYSDIRRRDPAPFIPEPYKHHLLDKFTTVIKYESGQINRSLNQKIKDKLLAYLLVLALYIDNFTINVSQIQSDLKAGMPKLISLLQIIGCYIINKKINNSIIRFAELKLPLYSSLMKPNTKLRKKLA